MRVSWSRVFEFVRSIERDDDIVPIRLCAIGDGTYILRDGRHRLQAHLELGISHISATIDNLITIIKSIFSYIFGRHSPPLVFIKNERASC